MSERTIKLVKKADKPKPKPVDVYIESHELSLLCLLVKKYPDVTKRLADKMKPHVV